MHTDYLKSAKFPPWYFKLYRQQHLVAYSLLSPGLRVFIRNINLNWDAHSVSKIQAYEVTAKYFKMKMVRMIHFKY